MISLRRENPPVIIFVIMVFPKEQEREAKIHLGQALSSVLRAPLLLFHNINNSCNFMFIHMAILITYLPCNRICEDRDIVIFSVLLSPQQLGSPGNASGAQ